MGIRDGTEVDLSALWTVGALYAMVLCGRTGVAGQVGAATDEARHDVQERLETGIAGLARRYRTAGIPGGKLVRPAVHATPGLGGTPYGTVPCEAVSYTNFRAHETVLDLV